MIHSTHSVCLLTVNLRLSRMHVKGTWTDQLAGRVYWKERMNADVYLNFDTVRLQ